MKKTIKKEPCFTALAEPLRRKLKLGIFGFLTARRFEQVEMLRPEATFTSFRKSYASFLLNACFGFGFLVHGLFL